MLANPTIKMFGIGVGFSMLLHLGMAGAIHSANKFQGAEKQRHKPGAIQVKVRPVDQPKPVPTHPPEQPKPKVKPKPPQPVANTTKQKPDQTDPPPPIQGLTEESLAHDGKGGFSAPVGNTLMVPDDGKRVKDAAPLTADLSSDPKLLAESVVIPSYTDAALDASYEGRVTVEVYVDESGKVMQAEPQKKVGYGMDERILQASLSAKFIPRKNRWGQAEPGWSKITFNLQVP